MSGLRPSHEGHEAASSQVSRRLVRDSRHSVRLPCAWAKVAEVRAVPSTPKKHAKGSEQISQRWVEGIERVCVDCGVNITNLAKQVGQVHRNPDGTGWIRCMECRPGMKKAA